MTESVDEKPIKESPDIKLDPTEEQILKDQINFESSDIKLDLIEEQILKDQINIESSNIKLDPKEEQILNDQINVTKRKVSYISLYRFATKVDWIIMFIGLMFSVIAGAASPSIAIFFGIVIDYFTNFQNHIISSDEFSQEVDNFSLIFVYFAIGIFVTTYISTATWVYTGERITRQIREQYLRAILRQNIAYFDKHGSGEVTTRITSDTHSIQDGISEKVAFACQIKGLESKSRAGIIAEEAISTIRTVVAFGAQKKLSNLYDTYLSDARKERVKKSWVIGISLGITLFVIYSSYALAFWYGSTLIYKHEMSAGQVSGVFFSIIIGSFGLSNFFVDFQAISLAVSAGSKIFETIDRVPPIDIASDTGDKLETIEGHIQLKNINFIYPTRPEVKVLNDVSLDVEPGSTVALVGSSGSGKSTIVSLVLRFYDPISGGVFIDGHDVKSLNLTWLRRQISLVSQEPILFKTTIAENISYGLIGSIYESLPDNEKREMIENACKMANAHDFIMNLPDKYETMVGERGILLSGGQKQRIAIARAIIKDPKILLLDEATSALDTASEGIVQNALDKASMGRTTIVIAHRLTTIRNAKKIIVMNKGVIVESGTHKELMDKKSFYFKLVETQQIQQTSKVEENLNENEPDLFIIPPKDDITIKDTIKDNENPIISAKQKADTEMGLKHNDCHYSSWELIKKIAFINGPESFILSIGIITSVLNGCIYPIFAITFANIIQALSETGETLRHKANFWSLIFFIYAMVSFSLNLIQQVALGFASEKLTERVQSMSFASILRQDISFFDEEGNGVGVLTGRLSLDVTHVSGLAGSTLGNLLQVMASLCASFTAAFIFGWKLTLVSAVASPVLIGAAALRIKMVDGFQQKTKKAYEYSTQIANEGASNIRTVAALTREDDLWKKYHNLLDGPMRQGFKNAYLASTIFAFGQSISYLINALTFWYGSKLFMDGEYDLQKMFVVYAAIIIGSQSIGRVFAYTPDMTKARSASATIVSLLERVPVIDTWNQDGEKVKTINGHLKFTDAYFHYPTRPNVPVLQGLNLEIKPGQYAALVGTSGCGKSTTVSLTERFYQLTSGTITIDGIDITKMNVNNLREHIALVSQEPSLYDMTIKENLLFGSRSGQNITQNDIENACREANIHEFIVGLPDGYDTRVGGKGTQLSGGQKQRIAIARALIRNPKILLLDEATSALDSESEKVVQKALDAAAHGRTTLAIAHRLSTIQHADVIYVIKDGKVHEQGTHQELLKLKGIYNMMYRQACGTLETIFENASDDENSTAFQHQSEINLIAEVDSIQSFNENRGAISSINQLQSDKTGKIEGRHSVIDVNLSLQITPKGFMNRRYATNCTNPTLVSTYTNISNNLVTNPLHNFSSPTLSNRPDLYHENDFKNIPKCPSIISFKVHIHWIYPSSPLLINLFRDISLRKFRKIVAKSCGIKVPKDCVIIWNRNLKCDGISVGEENNDRVVLKYLLKSGKVSGIKNGAMWKCLKSFWYNSVELSIVKKDLLE
ncbi:6198_t:CDS:2 [Racocetra persica]|uniref:6198_t:CDS:1 n=1 Tax=Racocetra persica TaxID=160502 RepID=A0ACA9KJ21_9GLOM|nr:6198_t:CDS:2 [Racocetra persica]